MLQHRNSQSVNLENMNPPPIEAVIFSPNRPPRIEHLETVYTPIRPPLDSTTSDLQRQSAANEGDASSISSSILSSHGDYFGQPNVHLLPDMSGGGYWPSHAWNQRVVLFFRGNHHLFFTRAEGGTLVQHEIFGGHVSGDMLLLKLSDRADEDGTWSYENILPDATEERKAQFLGELMSASCEWLPELISVFESAARCRPFERR